MPTRRSRAAKRLARSTGCPFTIKDSLDTAGVVTTAGTVGWRDRVPAATRRSSRASGRPAGSCSARRTRPSSPGPTRPTTTSTAGPRTRTTSSARPAAAAAGRPRSSPPAARRSTSAATAATASASPRTCAASPASSPPAGACRGPATGRASRACSSRSPSSGPIARRVEDLELVLPIIAGPDGEDPHVVPAPLGDPAKVDVGGLRVVWFGDNRIRTPTPETIDRGGGGRRRDRRDGGAPRGAGAARHRCRAAGLGGPHPRRWLRLAVAAHRAGRHARVTARSTRSAGSPLAPASRWPATP